MSERITSKDLQNALSSLVRAAQAAGINADGWTVDTGSKVNGNSWELYKLDTPSHGHSNTGLPAFLGWSNREAYIKLQAYTHALWFAAEQNK